MQSKGVCMLDWEFRFTITNNFCRQLSIPPRICVITFLGFVVKDDYFKQSDEILAVYSFRHFHLPHIL